MEQQFSREPTLSYSERKLQETLEYATHDLHPGPGYHLGLEGVIAPPLTHKELEAFFGVSLDRKSGVDIILKYNEAKDALVLHQLSYPMLGSQGSAKLLRTETIGYIPVIEINNQPHTNESKYMNYAQGDALIHQLGIQQDVEHDNQGASYIAWKTNLLSKTKGWKLREILEVPEVLTDYGSQTTTIMNEEVVDRDSFAVTSRKSITKSVSLFPESSEENQTIHRIDSVLEITSSAVDSVARAYSKTSARTFDPFVIKSVTESEAAIQAIPIDEDTYHSFQNALNEVIAVRNSSF